MAKIKWKKGTQEHKGQLLAAEDHGIFQIVPYQKLFIEIDDQRRVEMNFPDRKTAKTFAETIYKNHLKYLKRWKKKGKK